MERIEELIHGSETERKYDLCDSDNSRRKTTCFNATQSLDTSEATQVASRVASMTPCFPHNLEK